MGDETSTTQAARTATEPWKPVPKRRRPKTTEEQLADAMAMVTGHGVEPFPQGGPITEGVGYIHGLERDRTHASLFYRL